MKTFLDRLFEEKEQLNERIEKLESFLSSEKAVEIEPVQKSLLNVQLNAMRTYLMCLIERTAWLARASDNEKK